jgi:hypothetical protein
LEVTVAPHESKGVKDLYPTERNAVISITAALTREMSFRSFHSHDAMKQAFETQAKNRFAEIGLIVSVQWDPDVSDDPEDNNLYWLPRVIVEDRTDKIDEIDHDRMRHEIVTGEADGQPGYMRPDGTKHEDPKSKDIL